MSQRSLFNGNPNAEIVFLGRKTRFFVSGARNFAFLTSNSDSARKTGIGT